MRMRAFELRHLKALARPIESLLFVPLSVHLSRLAWLSFTLFTITYIAFQKKLLSQQLTAVVAKILFWPTFPITALLRLNNYWTPIDDHVIIGCAPMSFLDHPMKLHKMGVRGVINLCDEFDGPRSAYDTLSMTQLRLNTVDHYESDLKQLIAGVEFIKDFKLRGEKVYIHCKAGHGRAAAMTLCWVMSCHPEMSAQVVEPSSSAEFTFNRRRISSSARRGRCGRNCTSSVTSLSSRAGYKDSESPLHRLIPSPLGLPPVLPP